ncbi:hypothetical protein DKX38_020850 [Salix brachista]|uniref:Uncharacterized protein n=1 Tax=Salix brachista TaxID=2182728 RepID=A0A5N5KBN9_9ROSI|nr:hypothetical protein DKX38_020850 [Salix brachista]
MQGYQEMELHLTVDPFQGIPNEVEKQNLYKAGPRIRLGKDFAYRQMKIVATELLRFFRFKLADETRKITNRTMFTLHIDGSLHLRAIRRTES